MGRVGKNQRQGKVKGSDGGCSGREKKGGHMSQPMRIPEWEEILSDHWTVGMSHGERIDLATELRWKIDIASFPYENLSSIQKQEFAEWYGENR